MYLKREIFFMRDETFFYAVNQREITYFTSGASEIGDFKLIFGIIKGFIKHNKISRWRYISTRHVALYHSNSTLWNYSECLKSKSCQNRPKIGQNRPKNRSKIGQNRFWPISHDPETEPSFLSTHMPSFEKTGFSRKTGIRIAKITGFLDFGALVHSFSK